MIKDLYPVNKYPFEDLLLKNNYILNEETFKKYIHPIYCIHLSKKNEPCRRKKIKDEEYCYKHLKKDIKLINRCNYMKKNGKLCKKHVYNNKICHLHIFDFENKTYDIYNFLYNYDYNFYRTYSCKIYNKKIFINIIEYKEYIYSNDKNNSKIMAFRIKSADVFINEIFNKYESFLLSKYKIDIYTLLKMMYILYIFDKSGKNLPFSSNTDDDLYNIINENAFIKDDIFEIDDLCFDYYYDKDIYIDLIDIKYNMGLCLENGCQNKTEPDEDFCIQCFKNVKFETDDEEIYEMNINKLNNIIYTGYKKKKYEYNFIENMYFIQDLILIEDKIVSEKISYTYIKNIVTNYLDNSFLYEIINKNKYKIHTYEEYVIDILNFEKNLIDIKNDKKNRKQIKKFDEKYKKLIKLNEDTLKWIDENLKTNYYKYNVKRIIESKMSFLNNKIKNKEKDINLIRNAYSNIFKSLCDSWEFFSNTEEDNKHDFKICYNIQTWKMYAIHEDDDYKRFIKI